MPTYPVINTKTGEKQGSNLSMKKYDEWRKRIQTGIKTGLQALVVLPMVTLNRPMDSKK